MDFDPLSELKYEEERLRAMYVTAPTQTTAVVVLREVQDALSQTPADEREAVAQQSADLAHQDGNYPLAWAWKLAVALLGGEQSLIDYHQKIIGDQHPDDIDETRMAWWLAKGSGEWKQYLNKYGCPKNDQCPICKQKGHHGTSWRLRRSFPFKRNGKRTLNQIWLDKKLTDEQLERINRAFWGVDKLTKLDLLMFL